MNPAQAEALAMLNANRRRYFEQFPNQWIAVNANELVIAASRFDLLAANPEIDAERFVFTFIAAGAWA
ncbi:MAG: hypothetical protein M3R31_09285 [Pseudomonadota bacterium]|nr:hypothetical protein [Pseudomonadota bacterium]